MAKHILLTLPLAAALPFAAVALAAPPAPAKPVAFGRCAICHSVTPGGAAEMGPNLYGIAGRKAASRPGFGYSAALKKSGVVWTKATLTRWLADPQKVAPGTTMPNPALSPAEREAIASYLAALK